jgi:hypothetical protein
VLEEEEKERKDEVFVTEKIDNRKMIDFDIEEDDDKQGVVKYMIESDKGI